MAKQRSKRGPTPNKAKVKAKKAKPKSPRPRDDRPSRDERWAAQRKAQRRRSLVVRSSLITLAVLVVAGLVTWQVVSRRNAQRTITALTAGECRYDTESDPGAVNEHTPNPTFTVDPPAGGIHSPNAAPGGRFSEETAPEDGQVVHALEHGLIAISYRPDVAPDDFAALQDIQGDNPKDVLLLPRSSLEVPVAATAWHRRLLCAEVEPNNLRRFVDAYEGKGPENVPRP